MTNLFASLPLVRHALKARWRDLAKIIDFGGLLSYEPRRWRRALTHYFP